MASESIFQKHGTNLVRVCKRYFIVIYQLLKVGSNHRSMLLCIQILLYAVEHVCIQSHIVSITDNEVDFSFEQ